MSTYTDMHCRVRENITVDSRYRDTNQRVRLTNEENEYWGTFHGKTLTSDTILSNATIIDSTLSSATGKASVDDIIKSTLVANRAYLKTPGLVFNHVGCRDWQDLFKSFGPTGLYELHQNELWLSKAFPGFEGITYEVDGVKFKAGDIFIVKNDVLVDNVGRSDLEILSFSSSTTGGVVDVKKQDSPDEGDSVTYYVTQDGQQVGAKINIPQATLVKSAEVKTCEQPDVPVEGYVPGDKYIDFDLGDEKHLYVLVSELVDNYTAGEGLDLNDNEFSIALSVFDDIQRRATQDDVDSLSDVYDTKGDAASAYVSAVEYVDNMSAVTYPDLSTKLIEISYLSAANLSTSFKNFIDSDEHTLSNFLRDLNDQDSIYKVCIQVNDIITLADLSGISKITVETDTVKNLVDAIKEIAAVADVTVMSDVLGDAVTALNESLAKLSMAGASKSLWSYLQMLISDIGYVADSVAELSVSAFTAIGQVSSETALIDEKDTHTFLSAQEWVEKQGYITEHQSLADYYKKSETSSNAELADEFSKKAGKTEVSDLSDALSAIISTDVKNLADNYAKKVDININYDSEAKKIYLSAGDHVTYVKTDDFIKDGMISSVTYDEETRILHIVWNTDAGGKTTDINLSGLINTYYAGYGLNLEGSTFSIDTEVVAQLSDFDDYWKKSETSSATEISEAFAAIPLSDYAKVSVDNTPVQDFKMLHTSYDEYAQLVKATHVDPHTMYVLSADGYDDQFGNRIANVGEPEVSSDAATKHYVDEQISDIPLSAYIEKKVVEKCLSSLFISGNQPVEIGTVMIGSVVEALSSLFEVVKS